MSRFDEVTAALDRSVGGADASVSAHGAFWRGKSRDQLIGLSVFGRPLVVVGDGAGSNLVKALRAEAPFGSDVGTSGASFRRMPGGRPPMAAADIALIAAWIDDGCPADAPSVDDGDGTLRARMVGDVGFDEDVRPLFSDRDRQHMINFFDLHDWRQARDNAPDVLDRLRGVGGPVMPPEGWPDEKIRTFAHWMADGCPKRRGRIYADFFRDLDSYTEYHDVYGRPAEENYMPMILEYFGGTPDKALFTWREYAALPADDPDGAEEKAEVLEILQQDLARPEVKDAILHVEALMNRLLRQYFPPGDGGGDGGGDGIDAGAVIDAFEGFGRDRLPLDEDRLQRIRQLADPDDFRLPYAAFHRMDGAVMWFNWAGHIECAELLAPSSTDHAARNALLAAVAAGSAMDFVLRQRARTRSAYYRPTGVGRIRRKAFRTMARWSRAVTEAHELFQIFRGVREGGPIEVLVSGRFSRHG